MGRLLKLLFLAALAAAGFGTYSYLGARTTAGKLVGPKPPLGERAIEFRFDGVEELPDRPRAWVVTYARSSLPGVRTVRIYVSPTGALLGTRPVDLDNRLEAWEKAYQPP